MANSTIQAQTVAPRSAQLDNTVIPKQCSAAASISLV